jgi:hypothetical protein
MRRAGAGFRGSVVISGVATVLLLVAITGARRPVHPEVRGAPPWPAPGAVATGVQEAGLAFSSSPVVVTRYAVHLDVLVDGKPVRVPAGIGVDQQKSLLAPLSTSDDSGVIHVACDASAPVFTLGQFFDEWQVPLTGATAYVNGAAYAGDPGTVVLAPHQEILVSYGSPPAGGARSASTVPSRYAFPAGM